MAEAGQDHGIASDFLLEIVTPERQLVSERVDSVRAPGVDGEFGVLPSHVRMIAGVNYERICDDGLLISYGEKRENPTWIDVDNIVLCTGQVSLRDLEEPLVSAGVAVHVIGGADVATELDAKRAIDQGSRLAARL